jgi:hypothetical protein
MCCGCDCGASLENCCAKCATGDCCKCENACEHCMDCDLDNPCMIKENSN